MKLNKKEKDFIIKVLTEWVENMLMNLKLDEARQTIKEVDAIIEKLK